MNTENIYKNINKLPFFFFFQILFSLASTLMYNSVSYFLNLV